MKNIVSQLKQHTLIEANEIITKLGPEYAHEKLFVFARSKEFDGETCQFSWLNHHNRVPIEKVATAKSVDIYRCVECGFKGAFSWKS